MTSQEDDDEFERMVEEELSTAPLKALLAHNAKTFAIAITSVVLGGLRVFLAIYGLWTFHSWTITLVVLASFLALWARPLFVTTREVRKARKNNPKQKRKKPEEMEFADIQATYDNLEKVARPETPDPRPKFWTIFSPLGQSILAGIGVAHLLSPPLAILAALIFFGSALHSIYTGLGRFRRLAQSFVQMRPDRPLDTPET